ncbi:MAG: GTPase ObgE [Planctomycetes bacterium]|nr:GTPase ObgE [Planctomycetota bacterium]
MFVDEAEITVKAGNGGNGCVAFLREKFRPLGGPAGGDGGKGGDIILQADRDTGSLWELQRQRQFSSENGRPGEGKKRSGRSGSDLTLRVPLGTLVREIPDGPVIHDLVKHNQSVIVARGGTGGRGNARFATSTNQAPTHAEEGTQGEEKTLFLELRLIADVGLVGLPNAGKSTLISAVSAARPEIAPYPFTTKTPELGVVRIGRYQTLVLADLPGLIKGAHYGVGLGDRFLRHVERTRVIAHLVDIAPVSGTPVENYLAVRRELKLYSPRLAERPEILVLTKADLDPDGSLRKAVQETILRLRDNAAGDSVFPPNPEGVDSFYVAISAVTRYNLDMLLNTLHKTVSALPTPEME